MEYSYIKEDINHLIKELGEINHVDESLVRFLCKKIIFLKEINNAIVDDSIKIYIEQLISDLMHLIICYCKEEERYIYLNSRSIIEVFSRLFNDIEPGTNMVTMTKLLEEIDRYITLNNLLDNQGNILDYSRLKNIYSLSCFYVHGNTKVIHSLSEYYNEAVHKKINDKQKRKISDDIKVMINMLVLIACYRFSSTINDIFFRGKNRLSFLIGEFCVNVVKSYSNFVIYCLLEDEQKFKIVLTGKIGNKLENVDFTLEDYQILFFEIPETLFYDEYNIYLKCGIIKVDEDSGGIDN